MRKWVLSLEMGKILGFLEPRDQECNLHRFGNET